MTSTTVGLGSISSPPTPEEILLNSSVFEGIDHDGRHESQYPCDPDDFGRPPIEGLVLEFEPLQEIEIELESMRKATASYHAEGLKLIELVQVAHPQYLAANPSKQAQILKTVVSNLVFDGATITPTDRKPFDVLAERPSSGNWLPGQDGR